MCMINAIDMMHDVKGTHCLAELHGCQLDGAPWQDDQSCLTWMSEVIKRHHLTFLKGAGHTFENGGFTAVALLAESHISIHTWPEYGYITLDVFVCNVQEDHHHDAINIMNEIISALSSSSKSVQIIKR